MVIVLVPYIPWGCGTDPFHSWAKFMAAINGGVIRLPRILVFLGRSDDPPSSEAKTSDEWNSEQFVFLGVVEGDFFCDYTDGKSPF